ncbi:MAG: periplasmic heavy metal sensor [Verrucomicrobia bacterium]|nr:periplasmic heavy metal sensor [Verrucomicrobiota bacterium]
MKNKTLFTLMAAAAITVSGILSYANAAPARSGAPGRQVMQRIMSELDLSAEQIEKIKGELRAEKENVAPLLGQLHEARKGLRETIQTEGDDEKAIRAAHTKVAAVEADLAVQHAKIRGKIVPHLTEEQLQKMNVIEAKLDEMAINAIRNFGHRLGE